MTTHYMRYLFMGTLALGLSLPFCGTALQCTRRARIGLGEDVVVIVRPRLGSDVRPVGGR